MTDTPKIPAPASREMLEAEYLRRLFARDAHVWRERTTARDGIMSHSQVTRIFNNEPVQRQEPSIFEDSFPLAIGR